MLKLFIQKYSKSLVIYIVLLCSMLICYQEIKAQSIQKKVLEIPYINQGEYNDCVTTSFYMAIQAVNPKIDETVHQIIHQIKEYDGISPKIISSHSLLNNYIKKRTDVEAIHLSCNTTEIPLAGSLPCIDKIKSFIKKNINNGNPVILASTGWLVSASGHAVIVVGYDGNDYYYIHNPGAGDSHATGINQRVNINENVFKNKLLGDYSKFVPGPVGSSNYVIDYTASVIPKALATNRSPLNATVENNAFAFASPGAGKDKIDFKVNRTKPELYDFKGTAGEQYDSIPEKYKKIALGTSLSSYQIYNSSNTDKTAYLKIDIGREDATQKLNTMVSDKVTIPAHNYGHPPIGQISHLIDITKLKETDKQVDCYFKVSFYDENDSLFHQRIIRFNLDPGHFDFIQTKLIQCNEYELSLFDIQVPKTFQKVVYEIENKDTGYKDTLETTNKDGKVNYIFPQTGTFMVTAKVLVGGNQNIYEQTDIEITIKQQTVDFNVSNEGNKYIFKSSGGCQLEDVSYNWEITDSSDKEVHTKNNDSYTSNTFTDSGNYTVTLKAINNKTKKINGINSKKITVSITEDLSSKAKEAFLDKNWAELFNLYRAARMDSDKIIIKDYLHKLAIEFHNANTKHLQDFKEHRTNIDTSYNAFEAKSNRDLSRLEEAIKVTKAGSTERTSLQKQLKDLKQCELATNQQYQNDLSYTVSAIQVFEKLAGYDYTTAIKWLTAGPGIVLSDGHIAFFKKNDVKQLDIAYDLTNPIPKSNYSSYCSNSRILEIPPLPYIKIRASKTEARAGEIVELKAFPLHPPDGKGGKIAAAPDAEYDDEEIISWTGSNIITTHQHPTSRYESYRSFMATENGEYVIKAIADGYKPASITISVGGARTSGEILGLDTKQEFFGTTKEITYLATTSSGDAQVKGINYSQSIRWDSSPGLSFNPQETKGGGEEGIKTSVTFSRMLNPTKIWAEIFWQYKDGESKVKSPVREVKVVSPDFSLSFNPSLAQAKPGKPLIVTVESQPRVPNNLIEYRWVEPTNRKELDNGVIEIIPKDNKPINFHVIARVPAYGDVVNDNIKGQYIPGANKVTASLVGPKYNKDSQEWNEAEKGLVTKKPPLVTGQEIVLTVVVEDFDNEKVTYRWESNDGCSIHHGQFSRDVTVYRNEPGDCILKVTAYDKDKNALGTDELSISISEQDTTTSSVDNTKKEAAQQSINEAIKEANKGNFDQAITTAEKATILDPDNKEIKEQIQAIKIRKNNTTIAIQSINSSLSKNDFEKAKTLISQLEKDIPDSIIIQELNTELSIGKKTFIEKTLTDAHAHINKGNLEVAISNLEKGSIIDPDNKDISGLLAKSKQDLQKINSLHDLYKQAMSIVDYKKADEILKEMQKINRYHPDVVTAQSALFSEGQQKRSDLANKLYEVDKLIDQGNIDQAITMLETILNETESVNEAVNIRTDAKTKYEYLKNKKTIADSNIKEAERLINAGYIYYNDAKRLIENVLQVLPTYKPAKTMQERINALFAQQREDLKKQNELAQKAFQQLNNCNYDQAVELIEQAKTLNPDNVEIAKNAFNINNKRKAFLQSLNRARLYIIKGDINLAQMELDKHKNICIANSDYKSVQENFDSYKASVKKEVDELLALITKAAEQKNPALARQYFNKLKARKDLPAKIEPFLNNLEQQIDNLEKQLNYATILNKLEKQNNMRVSSMDQSSTSRNFEGRWNMLANVNYSFNLDLTQINNRIEGTMTRTNGNEPIDKVQGEVLPDGSIKFTRFRQNSWKQDYTGKMIKSSGKTYITGSFNQDGRGNYTWNAEKLTTGSTSSSVVRPTQTTQVNSPADTLQSQPQTFKIPNMRGDWNSEHILSNNQYRGTLKITHQTGNIFSGILASRGKTDNIKGVISGNNVKYTRYSQDDSKQEFVGTLQMSGSILWMKGTITGSGISGVARFIDQKKQTTSFVPGAKTSSTVKSSNTQSALQPKTIHIVFKNQYNSPVHFYGMGQKASSANKVMPGRQVSSSVRMAIPDVKYYASPTDMPKKTVSLLLNTLKQGQTITFIYNAAGHFYRSH